MHVWTRQSSRQRSPVRVDCNTTIVFHSCAPDLNACMMHHIHRSSALNHIVVQFSADASRPEYPRHALKTFILIQHHSVLKILFTTITATTILLCIIIDVILHESFLQGTRTEALRANSSATTHHLESRENGYFTSASSPLILRHVHTYQHTYRKMPNSWRFLITVIMAPIMLRFFIFSLLRTNMVWRECK